MDNSEARAAATAVRAVTARELTGYRAVVRAGMPAAPEASPVHPFVLAHPLFDEAVSKVSAPAEDAARVHLSQEIRVHRLLRGDEPVSIDVDVLGARREGPGVRLALRSEITGEHGDRVAELHTGVLLAGATEPEPFGELPPPTNHRTKVPPFVATRQITVDSVRRYAEVSGDDNPIHLDDVAARAAGFPGVIAHGMSVLALVCEEATDRYAAGDPMRIRGIGARFSAPTLPGEPLAISFQADADTGIVCFSVKTSAGPALKSGWIEVAPAHPQLPK